MPGPIDSVIGAAKSSLPYESRLPARSSARRDSLVLVHSKEIFFLFTLHLSAITRDCTLPPIKHGAKKSTLGENKSHLYDIFTLFSFHHKLLQRMKIGIVNAGNIGLNLGTAWIRHGYDIMLSKDTHPEQLRERAKAFGSEHGLGEAELNRFKYGSLADAAEFGDIVILSTYFPRMAQIFEEIQSSGVKLSGKIVIDTMNPLNVDAEFNHYHDLKYMEKTSTTEDVQKAFPEAIVFKAFSTMGASLLDVREWASGRVPPQIFIGGDSSSTDTVRKLIEDAGFRAIFGGYDLKHARLMENLSLFLHHLAENEYQGDANLAWDLVRRKGSD